MPGNQIQRGYPHIVKWDLQRFIKEMKNKILWKSEERRKFFFLFLSRSGKSLGKKSWRMGRSFFFIWQHIFGEHLLCVRLSPWGWEYGINQQSSCSQGAFILKGRKQKISIQEFFSFHMYYREKEKQNDKVENNGWCCFT